MSFIAGVVLATAGPAAAQQQPDPYAPGSMQPVAQERNRLGFAFGFAVGGGDLVCESESDVCDGVVEAGGVDLHGLFMFQQRLGLILDVWVMAHTEDRFTLSQTISTIGARYFLLPRLWVQAGIGHAHARATYDGPLVNITDRTDDVPGVMFGIGLEVLTRRSFALDVEFKTGTGFYDDESTKGRNVWLGAGFTWY